MDLESGNMFFDYKWRNRISGPVRTQKPEAAKSKQMVAPQPSHKAGAIDNRYFAGYRHPSGPSYGIGEHACTPLNPSEIACSLLSGSECPNCRIQYIIYRKYGERNLFIIILLMFIGASPGSCGGGIKTSSLASLVLLGLSRLRGQPQPQVFHRNISEASVGKALSLVLVSTVVIVAVTLVLLMSELGEAPHYISRGKFLELLFEVVSAFGTVGLSMGVTTGLSTLGKTIITLMMFIGRLGPLVVALAISRRTTARFYYADENIIVG